MKHEMLPKDRNGDDLVEFQDAEEFEELLPVAGKRTTIFGMLSVTGDLSLKEALQAAYIQGVTDAVEGTLREDVED